MEGHLWLLLQILPLLAAAAAVFFGLGWFWRGCLPPSTSPPPVSSTESADIQKKLIQAEAALQESQGSQNLLQKEMLRLADALKEAQAAESAALARLSSQRETFDQEKATWIREQQAVNESSKPASAARKTNRPKGKRSKD